MSTKLWRRLSAAVVIYGSLVAAPVYADWPERPVTLIVPFGAGGNSDILARALAQELSEEFGQSFIVENRPGAGSMIGSQVVARAKPDGYTLLLGGLATVLNDHLYKKPLIDVRRDISPVSLIATIPNYLSVSQSLPVESTADLIAMIKAEPGKHSCANSGIGTSEHLSCELLKSMAGLDMISVPYKSGVAAITDVIGGRATIGINNETLPYIKDRRLKGLAVTSMERSALAPELPPVADAVPGYDVQSWYAVFSPANTPRETIEKIDANIGKVVASKAMQERFVTIP